MTLQSVSKSNAPNSRAGDPYVHHGRHFSRTVHAMCNVQALITNSITCMGEGEEVAEEALTHEFAPVVLFHVSGLTFPKNAGPEKKNKFSETFVDYTMSN